MTRACRATLITLCLLMFTAVASARDYCIENWACTQVRGSDTHPEFWLQNKKAYPITVTLLVWAENFSANGKAQRKYTETRVLDGNGQLKVLALQPTNKHRRSRFNYDFRWIPGDMHAKHDNSVRYRLPVEKSKARMVQGFNGGFSHSGASKYAVDFAMPEGTPVYAARGGTVIDVEESNNKGGSSRRYAKYANFVVVLHDDRTTGEYYHLQQHGAAVAVGDVVEPGDLIGYSGNTGFSSLPHLHFAVYKAKSHGDYESVPFMFADAERLNRRNYGSR